MAMSYEQSEQLFTTMEERLDRMDDLLAKCLACVMKMKEDSTVTTTDEILATGLGEQRDGEQIDVVLPPPDTEEVVVAVPSTQLHLDADPVAAYATPPPSTTEAGEVTTEELIAYEAGVDAVIKGEGRTVALTSEEVLVAVPCKAPLDIDIKGGGYTSLGADHLVVYDSGINPDVIPDAQIHHDVVPPPTTTEEILVAVPETQHHLVGTDESWLAPYLAHSMGLSPVVVPFEAEHTLALIRKVFDGVPHISNYIVHERRHSREGARPLPEFAVTAQGVQLRLPPPLPLLPWPPGPGPGGIRPNASTKPICNRGEQESHNIHYALNDVVTDEKWTSVLKAVGDEKPHQDINPEQDTVSKFVSMQNLLWPKEIGQYADLVQTDIARTTKGVLVTMPGIQLHLVSLDMSRYSSSGMPTKCSMESLNDVSCFMLLKPVNSSTDEVWILVINSKTTGMLYMIAEGLVFDPGIFVGASLTIDVALSNINIGLPMNMRMCSVLSLEADANLGEHHFRVLHHRKVLGHEVAGRAESVCEGVKVQLGDHVISYYYADCHKCKLGTSEKSINSVVLPTIFRGVNLLGISYGCNQGAALRMLAWLSPWSKRMMLQLSVYGVLDSSISICTTICLCSETWGGSSITAGSLTSNISIMCSAECLSFLINATTYAVARTVTEETVIVPVKASSAYITSSIFTRGMFYEMLQRHDAFTSNVCASVQPAIWPSFGMVGIIYGRRNLRWLWKMSWFSLFEQNTSTYYGVQWTMSRLSFCCYKSGKTSRLRLLIVLRLKKHGEKLLEQLKHWLQMVDIMVLVPLDNLSWFWYCQHADSWGQI